MNNVKEKVLQTIRGNNMQPKSVLFFALKHIGIWFLWTLTVFVGACMFSAFLFRTLNSGFEYAGLITSSYFHFALSSFPFLWVFLIIVSMVVAHFKFRSTERGYGTSWGKIALINVSLSLFIGIILFFFGFGYVGEKSALRLMGTTVERAYLAKWNDVENGRIVGLVSIIDDDTLSLKDTRGTGYIVDISGLGIVKIPINIPVRLIGILTDDGTFYACHILPVRFRGAFSREEIWFQRVNEIKTNDERSTLCRDISTVDY